MPVNGEDEVVVVFGGSSGIGEAVARRVLARGSRVVIAGRDRARLVAAASRLGGTVRTAMVDAADRDAVDAFFARQDTAVDHLVLSFSSGRAGGPFRDLPMTELAAAVAAKLVAYLSVLQALLPRLRADGSVTFVGAGSASAALPATAGLAAGNGGRDAVVRPLAVELPPLRLNVVAPGVIQTPWRACMPEPVRDGVFARAAEVPAGRVGTPDDVADAGGAADRQRLRHRHRDPVRWRTAPDLKPGAVRPA